MRQRYWKLTVEEVAEFNYNEDKLLNWDIKCTIPPEDEAKFIGVFLYKAGTPLDYEMIHGITFYHNNLSRNQVPDIIKFFKKEVGGEAIEKGSRVFLKGSKEIYSGKEIASLAKKVAVHLSKDTNIVITLEFQDLTEEEMKEAGLPDAKLLPVPGK